MKAFDLTDFYENELDARNSLEESLGKSFQHVEFRTCDEGLDSLNYYMVSKEDIRTPKEALIALKFYECHVVEEWKFAETRHEHIDSIINNFLKPGIERYDLGVNSVETVKNSMQGVLKALNEYLDITSNYDRRRTETQAGVYLNSQRLSFEHRENIPPLAEIIDGISFADKWNEVVCFLETKEHYILFDWGTSA